MCLKGLPNLDPSGEIFESVLPGEWSKLASAAKLPSLLSCDRRLSPVRRLVKGDDSHVDFLPNDGEHCNTHVKFDFTTCKLRGTLSRLSIDRDLGVGVMTPRSRGELRLSLGVRLSSLMLGEAKSWLGLPSAWNEWQSSDVGVTEPGRKNESSPSTRSWLIESVTSGGLTSGRVGALVFALRGRPE